MGVATESRVLNHRVMVVPSYHRNQGDSRAKRLAPTSDAAATADGVCVAVAAGIPQSNAEGWSSVVRPPYD